MVHAPSHCPSQEAIESALGERESAGVEVGMMSELGPRVAPGIGPWGQRQAGPVRIRLGAGIWPHGGVNADAFRACFTGYLLDGSFCAPQKLNHEVGAMVCTGIHGGFLVAQGQRIDQPRTERRPWLAPRLGGRFSWTPETGGLVEFNLGIFFPLFRDTFLFEQPRCC